jgi:hypothetical protein
MPAGTPSSDLEQGARSGHRNAQYSIGGQPIRLVDGASEVAAAPGSATKIVTRYFGNEAWHDLNDDGREDVVFLLTQEPGGSGTFFYAVAALASDRGYVGSAGLLLGDRIAPQRSEPGPSGIVIVHYADRAAEDSFSARPSVNKSIWLKLDPATLELTKVAQHESEDRLAR